MTMPAATRAAGSRPSRAPLQLAVDDLGLASGLAVGEDLADAQDRAQAAGDGAVQLLADQRVRLAEVGAALGVAEDDPGGEAGQHRRGDLAGVGPGQLVVDVLGAHAHVLARQRVAHGGQAHVRRADDAGDPGLPRPRRDGPRELAGVGGGGVHLPVGGNHDRAFMPASCQSASVRSPGRPAPCRPPPGPDRDGRETPRSRHRMAGSVPAADALVVVEREPLHPVERPLDRRAVELEARGDLRQRRLGRLAARLGDGADGPSAARASRPSASSASIAASWRPAAATDRWRLALSALRTRLSSPRRRAGDAPRLELQERRARADAARGTRRSTPRSSRSRRRARGARATTRGGPTSARRAARTGASSGGTTNSRWARPAARLSDPRARNRPRSQAVRQCSGAVAQSRSVSGRRNAAAGRSPTLAGVAAEADDQAGDAGLPAWTRGPRPAISARRSQARDGSMAASSARSAATRSRSVSDIGPGQDVRPTRATPGRRRWPPSRSQTSMIAPARRSGSWWWAFAGSTRSSRTRRGLRPVAGGGQRSRTGSPSQPVGRAGVEPVVGEHDVGELRRRRGARGRRRGRRGRSRRSRPPGSRRCRRTRRARPRRRSPRGCPGTRSAGRMLVKRLPGPSTMISASAIARSGVVRRPHVLRA